VWIPAAGVLFKIDKGENTENIIMRLEKDGLIKSEFFLKMISKILNTETSFKTGVYRIMPEHTTIDIHDLLISGNQEITRITIPEGLTLKKIASYLEQKGITSADNFLIAARSEEILSTFLIQAETVEGFLFPDTYDFPYDVSAELIIQTMIKTFFIRLAESIPEYEFLNSQLLFEKIILASIVEREYRIVDEAPLIASVFYNRLKKKKNLESCATIGYIITEILGRPHPEILTLDNLKIESPYNTYIHPGLPMGPICNPGLTALEAVFSPAETDFLFFVLEDPVTGKHHFSRNLAEHKNARNLYLKQE